MPSRVPIIFGSGASGGGSSSGGSGSRQFDYQSILDTYRRLHEQANETRYQDILTRDAANQDRVGATYGQAFDLLENLGESEREQVDIRGIRDFASSDQDLTTRGLGNTTIRDSVRRGVGEDVDRSKRAITEQEGRQKAGVLQARAGAEERMGQYATSFMERRTDQGPDVNLLADLMSQAGAGQGLSDAASSTVNTGLSANARAGRDAFGQEMGGSGLLPANRNIQSGTPGDPRFGLRGGTGGPSGSAYITGPGGGRLPTGNGAAFRAASGARIVGPGATGGGGGAPAPAGGGGGGGGFGSISGPSGGFQIAGGQVTGTGEGAGVDMTQAAGTGSIAPSGGGAGFEAAEGQVKPKGGGGRTVTVVAGSRHARAPLGTTRTVNIPEGMSNSEATRLGYVPWGFHIQR